MNTSPSLPVAFRSTASTKRINVVATAASLSAAAGVLLGVGLGSNLALVVTGTTLPCALVWATMLRHRSTKLAAVVSVFLAVLNAGAALAFADGLPRRLPALVNVVEGVLAVCTFGALFWVPALVASWVVFGLPLHLAKRAADRGLGSEDRGERVVAMIAAIVAFGTLVLDPRTASERGDAIVSFVAAMGVVLGAFVTATTTRRERARHRFLRSVREGARAEYRLERNDAGREILLRVHRPGAGYRVAPLVEELLTLEERNEEGAERKRLDAPPPR